MLGKRQKKIDQGLFSLVLCAVIISFNVALWSIHTLMYIDVYYICMLLTI